MCTHESIYIYMISGQIPPGQILRGHIPTGQLPPMQNTPDPPLKKVMEYWK